MAEFITTTSEMLTNLKRLFKQEKSDRLRSVETIKLGVLMTTPNFPAIAIVPVTQQVTGIGTENVDIKRSIRFDVYTFKLDTEAAFNQCIGIINTLKTILRLSHTEKGGYVSEQSGEYTVYDMEISEATFDEQSPYNNGFIQIGSILVSFLSKGKYYNIQPTIDARWSSTQAKELMGVIKETLKAYKTDLLSKVAHFKSGVLTPSLSYPIIYVTVDSEEIRKRFAFADEANRMFRILTISKMLDKEESLLENLDITDNVLKILYANSYFGERVFHIDQPLVEYGQIDLDNNTMFGSSISFLTKSIEVLQ